MDFILLVAAQHRAIRALLEQPVTVTLRVVVAAVEDRAVTPTPALTAAQAAHRAAAAVVAVERVTTPVVLEATEGQAHAVKFVSGPGSRRLMWLSR